MWCHLWIQNLGPFSISYLEAQVTWNFAYKSLDCFLSSLQVTTKPSHLAKSQVTSVAALEISWVVLTSLFVFCMYLNQYMWHNMICFITYLQKAVRILFIDKLAVRCHRQRQHRRHRGLRWCCIQWRHYSVDVWRHNSVDADAWRREQRIARKTIGCVPKQAKWLGSKWLVKSLKRTETENSTSYLGSRTRPSDLPSYLTQDRR